ncbi:MAG TPA: phenylalanine--tRNA ligase beta subunit-related protein [Patescibacteria group bacterium]|nr:phenylalanine--tRNA ligase beta subunit-related protein [Patescibacteria group bacterium]
MKFVIEPQILKTFPGVSLGILIIDHMDNNGSSEKILKLLRNEETHQKELLTNVELGTLPEIAAWRRIYKTFGSDPHDYRSSVESLLRRARGGAKPLPQINNLVDLYNYISLKYHVPVGAENLDAMKGDLWLRFASGTEGGRALGSDVDETCYIGEVVYADEAGFVCRRWNWREAERTKITESTTRAIMVMEKVPEVADQVLSRALEEAGMLVKQLLHGDCQTVVMNNNLVSVDLS